MKILFDQATPAPLRHTLVDHTLSTAYEMGWATLENGDLLSAAEASFDAFITTDQDLRSQQDLSARRLAILVLPSHHFHLEPHTLSVAVAHLLLVDMVIKFP